MELKGLAMNASILGYTDFFNTYWDALEERGIQAAILHTWQDFPARIASDVDYAVSHGATRKTVAFLSNFARQHGWRLVQVIEHEPEAYYCVCIQYGGDFKQLDLDVTGNYGRLGHHLISSNNLLKDRRIMPGKRFQVPSPGVELCYIIAKAAAKNKTFSDFSQRAEELIEKDLEGCRNRCSEIFSIDLSEMPESEFGLFDWLENWFPKAEFFKSIRAGRRLGLNELLLYLRRILQPTGLWLTVKSDVNSIMFKQLTKLLAPLYRHTSTIEYSKLPNWMDRCKLIVRTSLLAEARDSDVFRSPLISWGRLEIDGGDPEFRKTILDKLSNRIDDRFAKYADEH
jgi:hypothetical protein